MSDGTRGLAKAEEIYRNRSQRALALKAQGRKVMGYMCSYIPLEILTALGILPYRIFGDIREPITEADKLLPTSFCPFVRSCIDSVYKNKYDFLNGVAGAHSCDPQEKTSHVWKSKVAYEIFPYLDMPATTHEWGERMFRRSLENFKKTLEAYVGKEITPDALKKEIALHNEQRQLVRDLYDLKKPHPPLISGTETLQVMMALASVPLEEGNEMLREVIRELKDRTGTEKNTEAKRVLVFAACLDDISLIQLIEDMDASVVMDENCTGPRAYFTDVDPSGDPMEGLTTRYLQLTCARTFREAVVGEFRKDREADLEARYAYLGRFIRDWKVDGVIIQLVRFCDPFGYEIPELKDYLKQLGVPNMYLETEYTTGGLAAFKTRVQTFLETLI